MKSKFISSKLSRALLSGALMLTCGLAKAATPPAMAIISPGLGTLLAWLLGG